MLVLRQVTSGEDAQKARTLLQEYLEWVCRNVRENSKVELDIEPMLEESLSEIETPSASSAFFLLAFQGYEVVGVASLREIRESVGEIKRMYVRPVFRGRGIGRKLLEGLIRVARERGYRTIRLDSTQFMREAHSLYRSAGFKDVAPYPESEISDQYGLHMIFMEKQLVMLVE